MHWVIVYYVLSHFNTLTFCIYKTNYVVYDAATILTCLFGLVTLYILTCLCIILS